MHAFEEGHLELQVKAPYDSRDNNDEHGSLPQATLICSTKNE